MFLAVLILLTVLSLLLILLKVLGVPGLTWLLIGKIIGYPAAFLGAIALLALAGVGLFKTIRFLVERQDRNR